MSWKREKFHGSRFQEAEILHLSAPAAACNCYSSYLQRERQSPVLREDFGAKVGVGGISHSTTCQSSESVAGILGPCVQLEIFSFAFTTAATVCSFAGASWLGSCSARELAEPWQAAREVFITHCKDVTGKGQYLATCSPVPLRRAAAAPSVDNCLTAPSQPPSLLLLPAVRVCKPGSPRTPRGGAS